MLVEMWHGKKGLGLLWQRGVELKYSCILCISPLSALSSGAQAAALRVTPSLIRSWGEAPMKLMASRVEKHAPVSHIPCGQIAALLRFHQLVGLPVPPGPCVPSFVLAYFGGMRGLLINAHLLPLPDVLTDSNKVQGRVGIHDGDWLFRRQRVSAPEGAADRDYIALGFEAVLGAFGASGRRCCYRASASPVLGCASAIRTPVEDQLRHSFPKRQIGARHKCCFSTTNETLSRRERRMCHG